LSESIYCPIRKLWVAALPEEQIRQRLLDHMIKEQGFPSAHIAIEKSLASMPHLAVDGRKIPSRRADIVCFSQGIHPQYTLFPLLLIECKAVPLTSKVLNQTAGYNHYLQAYFIAVVNQTEIKTGWYDHSQSQYVYVDFLPSYSELVKSIKTT